MILWNGKRLLTELQELRNDNAELRAMMQTMEEKLRGQNELLQSAIEQKSSSTVFDTTINDTVDEWLNGARKG